MSTEGARIEIRGIEVEIVRKDIKHLHLGVYPPEGRVRVAAPLRLDNDAVRLAVISRLAWIRRKRAEFQGQDRQSRREFVTGESHYFEGRRYRLDVIESTGPTGVRLRDKAWMEMRVRPDTERDAREAMLYRWYRAQLRDRIPQMIAEWEPRIGVTVVDWRIRRMKTRWGTCNPEVGRIWLNSELAKKPVSCLEYVVVHEMIHLIERGHGEPFRRMLDRLLPGWQTRRAELNRDYLPDETWCRLTPAYTPRSPTTSQRLPAP
ncbi:MAG: M48 family metallopeptidase [Gemmatimonadetes bacterium]|nr:M48 family metallopeptidase [Gemmatimonadota bacterium]MYE95169.1 M48 family metallopeptidase [Gemmatimonadota bacterium]MYJ11867.1 M48 family metallopeptidase [Gemmatimonadota bacterium]